MKDHFEIADLCETFEVSRSGFYDWLHRQSHPSRRAVENQSLKNAIVSIYHDHEQRYGSPRIQQELADLGMRHGRNRIARLMRLEGLYGRPHKQFKLCTTDSKHDLPIAPNLLAEMEPPQKPNQVWVGDITYIATESGWLYLAGVMDLYSRRIVGWAMSERIDTALVLQAWNMAVEHRQPEPGLIFHSDRGVQYASKDFRAALAARNAIASMSKKACCYDNAAMESFWSTLKLELVYIRDFQTHTEARHAIFKYIEAYYNRKRRHSSINYKSPVDLELQNN